MKELTVNTSPTRFDPLDVSRAELYANDTWREPFSQLRAEAPIYRCTDSKFGDYWSVSTYQHIMDIEALPQIFSSSWEYGGITIAFDTYDLLEDEVRLPMFIAMDPPICVIIVSEHLSSAQCSSSIAGRLDVGSNCPEMRFEMSLRFM